MNHELQQAQCNNLPTPTGNWGPQDTSAKDILIPSLLLMHELSVLVKNGKVTPGSIVNSVSGEPLADKGKNVEIIPILTFREWEVMKLVELKGGKTKEEYVGRVRMNAQNEDLPYQFEEGHTPHIRRRCIVCFVLVAGQEAELPYLIRFKKSNLYAGKKLSTHFQISAMKNRPPAAQAFGLFSETQTRNDNTFFVLNVTPTRAATKQEIDAAYQWYKTLSAHDVKVTEAEEDMNFDPTSFPG